MSRRTEAPQQHGQRSRKGKQAWRKNVDVSEIQKGLEIARDEVIKGGIIAEKSADQLFIHDTAGSQAIKKAYGKVHKPLKADQILAQRSAVPAVDNRKRKVTDGVLEPSSKRKKSNGVSPRELERLKARAYGGDAILDDIVRTDGTPTHDPWAVVEEKQDERFTFLPKKKPVRAPETLKEASISLLVGNKTMPAIAKPSAVTSYMPDGEAYDQALEQEEQKEVEAENKRLRAAQIETAEQARIAAALAERDDLQTEDGSAWEGFESDYEAAEWLKKKRPERKTQAERNKINRRRAAEREERHMARMKQRDQQAKEILEIAEEMGISMGDAEALVENRSDEEVADIDTEDIAGNDEGKGDDEVLEEVLRRRKLGKVPLPQKNLEFLLPDELPDSLRRLKPEGNLLKDRFRSIMVRGKVETRKPVSQPKKAKRTYTEKWTYKDFTVLA